MKKKKVAYYSRMNHKDRDYKKYLEQVKEAANNVYGADYELKIYHEIASALDPDRKKFNALKEDIKNGEIKAVIALSSNTITRDWEQFFEFMDLVEENDVEVICLEGVAPQKINSVIRDFINKYFD